MIVENRSYRRDTRVNQEANALHERGYLVNVICPGESGAFSRQIVDGVAVYNFPHIQFSDGTVGYFLEYIYATAAILALTIYVWLVRGFDIIHVANPPDCIIPVLAVFKLINKQIVYDHHDLSPELYAARFLRPKSVLLKLQIFLERLSYRLANQLIVTNESYRTVALERGGCSPSNITIVRNGPSCDFCGSSETSLKMCQESPHIIAFVGTIGRQDGLDYLCRSLHYLRTNLHREDFFCTVMGDGDALEEIQHLTHELDLDPQVLFTGWISDHDLLCRYLAGADICVSPEPSNSYNDRSTFIKVMEYMAAGKPIVSYDLPETRISAGQSALFATPNSEQDFAVKLVELMDDPQLRARMGQLGRQRVKSELAWCYSIPNLMSVYNRLERSRVWNEE